MDQTPSLTEATVRRLTRSQSYDRGENYYERGAVVSVTRRGEALEGEVEGSQYEPYSVQIELDETGIVDTTCSCPYDYSGICKHRVAVLLTWIRDPETVDRRPPVEEQLDDLDRDALYELLVDVLADRPDLTDEVEQRLETRQATSDLESAGEPTERQTSPDPETIRSHVQSILTLSDPRSTSASSARADMERRIEDLYDLLDEARAFIDAGEPADALDFLDAMAAELMGEEWLTLSYDDVTIFEFLDELGMAVAEATLEAGLSTETREEWTDHLDEWADEMRSYGGGSTFAAAADAAEYGWQRDGLQQVLSGEVEDLWDGEQPWYADELVTAWLTVLDRQDRTDAYLNLAAATDRTEHYATKLIEVGRHEDAVAYALDHLSTPGEALSIARKLLDCGHPEAAIRVGKRGLGMAEYRSFELAAWLRDAASATGDDETAQEAAITAFKADPSMETYRAVKEVADDDWPTLRDELLEHLSQRQSGPSSASEYVEIFLSEDMLDEATAVADRTDHDRVVEQVADTVWEERPQWTIEACKAQAEPIIENGESDRYRQAVDLLETAGRAARAAGELDEWRAYVETLHDDHYRKYKLRPMLEDLLAEFETQ